MKHILTLLLLLVFLAACVQSPPAEPALQSTPTADRPAMGGGMGPGMMGRHHAQVPEEYRGVKSPLAVDDAVLGRGQETYALYCLVCHGETGMGEGPAGAGLDTPPAPVAHTSQMLGDDYLFWRVSEGGGSFSTAMPGWKDNLSETQRWELIAYVRALGQQGADAIATAQAARQDEMLRQAVEQGVLTQAEAGDFRKVHDALEAFMQAHPELQGSMDERENAALLALVEAGEITQQQADDFHALHDKLVAAGLMQ